MFAGFPSQLFSLTRRMKGYLRASPNLRPVLLYTSLTIIIMYLVWAGGHLVMITGNPHGCAVDRDPDSLYFVSRRERTPERKIHMPTTEVL